MKLLAFTVLLIVSSQLRAQPLTINTPGVGNISLTSFIRVEHKVAFFEASARNDTGKAIRHAELCVRAYLEPSRCLCTISTTQTWLPDQKIEWKFQGAAVGRGLPNHTVSIVRLYPVTIFDPVQNLFVDEIAGANGGMSSDQLKAIIANTQRFHLVEDRSLADAILLGRSETREGGSQFEGKGHASASATRLFGVAMGGASSSNQSRTELIVTETLVLRLVGPNGETMWAWDDTQPPCGMPKAKCAIADLVAEATK